MIKQRIFFALFAMLMLTACDDSSDTVEPIPEIPEIEELVTCISDPIDPSDLANGDPLPIVAGKLLSFAVSTADECAYTPPGKWVNLYGVVYYRYVERGTGDEKNSVAGLVKESAEAVASILTNEQVSQLAAIVPQQLIWEDQARSNRDLIARELYKWRLGETGDETLILNLTSENGTILKDLVHQRTSVYGETFKSFTTAQQASFCSARNSENTNIDPEDLQNIKSQLSSSEEKAALNLVLSKFFSFVTGTEEMNQLVDDGRPAVYFGFANLRVEDREGDDVSNSLRKDASNLIISLLSTAQKTQLDDLVIAQAEDLDGYYSTRAELASLLVNYQRTGDTVDLDQLLEICTASELAEARLAIIQAKEMGKIIQSLDTSQMQY